MNELVERRVLGAIEFVSAVTGARILEPLKVDIDGVTPARNGRGLYVLRQARGLEQHTTSFQEAPDSPPEATVLLELKVEDPQRHFLPRVAEVRLPRSRAAAGDPGAALTPITIKLFPAAAAPTGANWALLRARVRIPGTEDIGLVNALLRVAPQLPGANPVLAMTDARGEALVAVPGVPPVLPAAGGGGGGGGGGAVLTSDFPAAIEVVLDEEVVRLANATPPVPRPNPDTIETRLASSESGVSSVNAPAANLSAGKTVRMVIEAAWP